MSKYKISFADRRAPAFFPKTPSGTASVYSLVILYENSEAKERADRFSDDLIHEIGGDMLWRKEAWDLARLSLPKGRRTVTEAAAIADLLILSLEGNKPWSDDFKAWMEEWAAHLFERSPVLIAHFDIGNDRSDALISNQAFLDTIVEICGLTFLCLLGDQIVEYPTSCC